MLMWRFCRFRYLLILCELATKKRAAMRLRLSQHAWYVQLHSPPIFSALVLFYSSSVPSVSRPQILPAEPVQQRRRCARVRQRGSLLPCWHASSVKQVSGICSNGMHVSACRCVRSHPPSFARRLLSNLTRRECDVLNVCDCSTGSSAGATSLLCVRRNAHLRRVRIDVACCCRSELVRLFCEDLENVLFPPALRVCSATHHVTCAAGCGC